MAENHELALRDYVLGMKYREIADKYNVSVDTVKKWKTRYRWERDKPVKTAVKPVHSVHKREKVDNGGHQEPEEETLTDQEQLFCYHYVRTWNATQAALKSGYSKNKASTQVTAHRLLQRPRIRLEIDRLRELFKQEIHIDIQDFLAFCLKVIGADIGDYLKFGAIDRLVYDDNGPIKDPDTGEYLKEPVNCISLGESEELDTSIIQEVKQGKDGISIKLADKKWAWEQLIKYFDWLPDKWQRNLENKKLEILQQKNGIGDNNIEPVQFVDDIGGDDDASD